MSRGNGVKTRKSRPLHLKKSVKSLLTNRTRCAIMSMSRERKADPEVRVGAVELDTFVGIWYSNYPL